MIMTCLKKHFAPFALLLSAVLISDVEGQGPPRATCGTFPVANTGNLQGSEQRTYANVCNCDASAATTCTANTGKVETTIFCGLIDDLADVKAYLNEGDTGHTLFVPSDSAFNGLGTAVAALPLAAKRRLVEIHILPTPKLTSDLICGDHVQTLNLLGALGTRQFTRTLCRTGGSPIQIGPGNNRDNVLLGGPGLPQIGTPNDMFDTDQFAFNELAISDLVIPVNQQALYGQDVIMCNGIVHTVNQVIWPDGEASYYGGKGGKSGKSAKNAWNWRHERQLGDQEEEEEETLPLGRKRSLEVLLEANGDVVIQDEEVDREDRKSRIESNLESLLEPN